MTRALGLVLLLGLPALAEDPDPEPVAGTKKLQGEWELISLRRRGSEAKLPPGLDYTMTIGKGKLTVKMAQRGRVREVVSTFKVDPRKSPRHIDQTDTATRRTTYGIYKLETDRLTIAAAADPKDRPKDFTSAQTVMVFKRKKK